MKFSTRILKLLLAVLLSYGFIFVSYAEEMNAADENATLHWARKLVMSTPVSGVVSSVKVQVGERVKKGQIIATLDNQFFLASVAAKAAQLTLAMNARDEAQREVGRTQELYDMASLSDHALRLVKILLDASEAQYQSANAALVNAKQELDLTVVRAPFNAWVIKRYVEVGQTIISRQVMVPIIQLAESDYMVARIQLPGHAAGKLKIGEKAIIMIEGEKHMGKISSLAMERKRHNVDEYEVDVLFAVGRNIFRSGQPARVLFN